MIGMDFKAAKAGFFDRKAVKNKVDRTERRVLSKFGAFVRKRSRSSIRKRKKISKSGSPPSSHTGLLKRFILFSYDSTKRSVVIGPTKLNGTNGKALKLLEYGGRDGRKVYRARPFMGPAFEYEKTHSLPDMWKNAVK